VPLTSAHERLLMAGTVEVNRRRLDVAVLRPVLEKHLVTGEPW
jgi:hypothetical protein